jgi:alpha-glucosidase
MPGTSADVTKPVPGLDIQKVCDYAKSKGVGIRLGCTGQHYSVDWRKLLPNMKNRE